MDTDIQKEYASMHDEFNSLTKELYKDLKLIVDQIKNEDNQTWRRLYVKSLCSAIEAQLSFLESHIKLTGKTEYLGISDEDERILNGHTKDGSKKKKLSFLERTVFLMNTFSNVNYASLKVNKNSKDWIQFTLLIKIRNRITHPQTLLDITIVKEEIQICESAFNKFQDSLSMMFKACEEGLMLQAKNLQMALRNLK